MSTVRRLYFYGLAYISAGVVIWGLVNLLRTLLSGRGSVEADTLATGLSLVLVGAPIFWMHWRIARRDAIRDPEERASRILAIFLYGTLLGTLIPIIYGILALVNRAAVALFGLRPQDAWFGGQGTALDNLVAVLINAGAFFFFWRILRADWLEDLPEHFLRETRRFYHYALVILSLVIFVAGVYNILRYLLQLLSQPQFVTLADLAAGISLLIVGAPLWYFFWGQAQFLLADPYERGSLLRLVVLYLISLAAVVGVLTTAGGVIQYVDPLSPGAVRPVCFLSNDKRRCSCPGAIGGALGLLWPHTGHRSGFAARSTAPGSAAPAVLLHSGPARVGGCVCRPV
jgi:hypothetical protein